MNKYVREDLRDFVPYYAKAVPYKVKLDMNESPFSMPSEVLEKYINWLRTAEDLNIYPDTDSTELREKLAGFWNVGKENIVCGVGSDQLIDYITKVFLSANDTVLTLKPTFSMYALTAILNHGQVAELDLNSDYDTDSETVINAVKKSNAKLLFICSPNNPTGKSLEISEIKRIAENVDSVVVVDEAYAEFSQESIIPDIGHFENIIALRTFSKAYGLAGARVGYAITSESLCDAINIVKVPFNLSTLSQKLAVFALEESEIYKERIALILQYRDALYRKLQAFEFLKATKSASNFIYIESSKPIADALLKNGILVRNFTAKTDVCEKIRLSVGMPEQNRTVIDVIQGGCK